MGVCFQALVTDIVPDAKVRAAMNDINASQRLRCALLHTYETSVRCFCLLICLLVPDNALWQECGN